MSKPKSTQKAFDRIVVQSAKRLLRFYGKASALSSVALLILGAAFFWLWQMQEWQVPISATAAGLGAVLAAGAGLVSPEEKGRWILAIAGGIFTAWVTWYANGALAYQLNAETEVAESWRNRFETSHSDFTQYVRELPPDAVAQLVGAAGTKLRTRFNAAIAIKGFGPKNFQTSRDIIDFIKSFRNENDNGHVQYFLGEIERKSKDPQQGHQRFFAYLRGAEDSGTDRGALGDVPCRTADGFCRERTAWVNNLLAHDFFADAEKMQQAGQPYQATSLQALRYGCASQKLFKAEGFNDRTQLTPTTDLVDTLTAKLGRGC
jgi:hypothetical protein